MVIPRTTWYSWRLPLPALYGYISIAKSVSGVFFSFLSLIQSFYNPKLSTQATVLTYPPRSLYSVRAPKADR